MRTPFSRGCRHGCHQHIGLERIRCREIRREGYPIRIQNVAEGEGFEPPKACTLVVFKPVAPKFANVRGRSPSSAAYFTLPLIVRHCSPTFAIVRRGCRHGCRQHHGRAGWTSNPRNPIIPTPLSLHQTQGDSNSDRLFEKQRLAGRVEGRSLSRRCSQQWCSGCGSRPGRRRLEAARHFHRQGTRVSGPVTNDSAKHFREIDGQNHRAQSV